MQSTNDQARAVLRTLTPSQLTRLDLDTLIAPFWQLFSLTGPNLSFQQFRNVWGCELERTRDEVTRNRRAFLSEFAETAHAAYVEGHPLPHTFVVLDPDLIEQGIDENVVGDIWHVIYGLLVRIMAVPEPELVAAEVLEPEPEIGIAIDPEPVAVMSPERVAEPRRIEPAEPADRTGDYTLAEMAEGFGVDVETVKQWIKRACLTTASDGKVTEKAAHRFLRQHEAEVKLTDTNGLWLETLKRLPRQGMRQVCPECRKAGRVQDAA